MIVPVYTMYMECYGHAEIVYAFQSIEKKVMKGRIKESPWRSRKLSLLFCKSDAVTCCFV